MRKLTAFAALAAVGLSAFAGEKWVSYTSDDFALTGFFAEYWKADNSAAVKSVDGHAVFNGKVMMIPKAKTPKKFKASVTFDVKKGSADLRCGTIIETVKAGEKKTVTIQAEGAQDGFAPIRIVTDGEGTIDDFQVWRAVDDSASPNLVVNGGMEHVEDTMPPYFKHGFNYPISQWRNLDYVKYTEMCRADSNTVHSGKYSLRFEMNEQVRSHGVGVVRISSRKGASGVFSLWAKTDVPGTKLNFSYAGSGKSVTLTNVWTRYEVVSTNLPAELFFQKIAGISVSKPEKARHAVAWVDDVQAEYLDPVPSAAEIKSGKTFATPFRENDFDKVRFSNIVPHRAPTIEVPRLAKGVKPSVKLDDWVKGAAKFGDYYNMLKPAANKTDAYVACDEENIYVGVRAYGEKFRARPAGRKREHDTTIMFGAQSSSVEFWFDPTGDYKNWQLAFNDFGCWDAGAKQDVKWEGEWTSEVVGNDKAGSADYFIAFPWKHLKHYALKDAFPAMLGRNDSAGGECVTPYPSERGGFQGTWDWWPLLKFPSDIVAKYRLAENPEKKVAKTTVMPWLSFYMNEPEAKFRITTPDGKMREEKIDITKMPYGTNTVKIAGTDQQVIKLPYRAHGCQVNHWARCLRKDGKNILHCGPFPGDFIFCWSFTTHGVIDYVDFFHKYCHFKYLHLLVNTAKMCRYFDGEEYKTLHNGRLAMERARQFGVNVLLWTGFGGKPETAAEDQKMADQFCEFSNLTSILVVDEPELGCPSDAIDRYMTNCRKLFPYNPVQMNNTIMGIPNNYANLNTDILMLDNYITAGDQQLVSTIVKCADEMWEKGAEKGKPCFFFVSSNNGHHYKDTGHDEQIAQCWGSVCAGCTGISFYEGIPTSTGSFKAMCEVAQEFGALEDVLVSDEYCEAAAASVGTKDLKRITRKLGDRRLVAACNIQRKPLGTVEFTLPKDFPQNGTVKVHFENRTIPVKDGKFSDDFATYARHVYELQ